MVMGIRQAPALRDQVRQPLIRVHMADPSGSIRASPLLLGFLAADGRLKSG